MKLAIMQPYFFPYIGYFQMIKAVDQFVLYDDVQYIQRGWINRNYILSKEGKSLVTVPVKKTKVDQKINEVIIAGGEWKSKFLNTLQFTYRKAPFFSEMMELIEKVISFESNKISELASKSIFEVCDYLGVSTTFSRSSELQYNRETDKKEKITSLITTIGATELVLPPGSRELYNKNDFHIKTSFVTPDKDIHYKQFSRNRYEPNLSIIDVLMFNGVEEVNKIIQKYTLQ